jgi:hypothetical protein
MKTKMKLNFFRLFLVLLLTLALTQSSFAVDIVGFTLGTGTSGAATSGVSINYPDMGRTLTAVGLSGTSYSTTNGLTGAGWDNNGSDGFYTNAFSTVGYLNVTYVGQIKGQNGAPKYLKAQYSFNGTSWTDVPDHISLSDDNPVTTVTSSFPGSLKFRLPAECDNQTSVYIRMIQDGSSTIGGVAPSSSATISMKSVVVQAEVLAAPTSQSTQITIVSLTPTTITLGCTPGSGNRRYIAINTTNSFTTPANDFIPSANSNYAGSGEQIIYVGTGTAVTVTVPSSLNTYWFRYFEYNQLDNLTRFSTIDASASKNPKMCALPNIHTPTHSFGLIRATLGATIDPVSGDVGEIIDRGIFWSISAGVNNNSTLVQEGGTSSGVFTVDTEVDRGITIYYRGYAENESGVILSPESSFSNVPIFTGTGTWETAARWNVQEVPGANGDVTYGSVEDSPIINGNCTLTASNNVTNLTINSSRNLTISNGVSMDVDGTLTNNAGTSGILIKSIDVASDASSNGSLIFANGTPQATVEMFSKSEFNTLYPEGSKYKWQFFGIPVTSASYMSYFNNIAYVREWDESVTSYWDVWVRKNDGTALQLGFNSNLTPELAYEICSQYNHKYSFVGTLNTADFSKTLQYSPTAYFKGQNLLSNPYTASMDIREMQFGANTQAAVYLYNTGTYNDWITSNGETTPGEGPGTYKVLTPGTAGSGGVNAEIAGMQGFIVKATANPGSVSYSKTALISNTQKQRAKAVDTKVSTMIDLRGTKFSDRMWVFVDDNCTEGFDNGFDGPKMLGNANVSQLYGIGTDDIYQINVLNNINDAYIGVQKGTEESFKLTFNHTNISQKYQSLYLMDLTNNQTIDITTTGSEYSFTSTELDPVKRFKIVGISGTTTSTINVKNDDLKIISQDKKLIIDSKLAENGELQIFDLAGKLQAIINFNGKSIITIAPNLQKGIYIARLTAGSYGISQRIIIN